MTRSKLFMTVAAALLLSLPLVAQHQHGQHGQGHEKKQGASCPHMTGLQTSVDQAIALLEKDRNVDQALARLREAKTHLGQCQEMCAMHMKHGDHGNHGGHGDHKGGNAKQ